MAKRKTNAKIIVEVYLDGTWWVNASCRDPKYIAKMEKLRKIVESAIAANIEYDGDLIKPPVNKNVGPLPKVNYDDD